MTRVPLFLIALALMLFVVGAFLWAYSLERRERTWRQPAALTAAIIAAFVALALILIGCSPVYYTTISITQT